MKTLLKCIFLILCISFPPLFIILIIVVSAYNSLPKDYDYISKYKSSTKTAVNNVSSAEDIETIFDVNVPCPILSKAKLYRSADDVREAYDCIYVLDVGNNIVKIGCTNNARSRITTHSREQFRGIIRRIAVFENVYCYRDFESYLHSHLRRSNYSVSINGSSETYRFTGVNSFDFAVEKVIYTAMVGYIQHR